MAHLWSQSTAAASRTVLISALAVVMVVSTRTAVAAQPIDAEQFTPPVGRQPGASSEAPGVFRLLLATSADALTFTRSNFVLSDQANTPNMIVTSTGRILIYYTGAAINGSQDGVAVAVSDDNAASWRYFRVRLLNFPAGLPPLADPDVILESDGTFRIYLTGAVGNVPGIYTATSTDGFNFAYGGVALVQSTPLFDSLTRQIGSTYHMYLLNASGQNVRASSFDGRTFTVAAAANVVVNGQSYFLSNWMPIDSSTFRIYAFSLSAADIRSFRTIDGVTLTAESGARLTFGSSALESVQIKDPAVARLSDGRYLMAYTSKIPADTTSTAPGNFAAQVTGRRVFLSWTAPSAGLAPTQYLLEAGSAPGLTNLAQVATGSAATSVTADGVPPGTYYVRVRALTSAGLSAASNEITVAVGATIVPSAPAQMRSTVNGSTVTLIWSLPATGGTPTSYILEAGSAPGLVNLANFATGNTQTTFTAGGVPPGTYFVRVRAMNEAGVSGASNEITVIVGR